MKVLVFALASAVFGMAFAGNTFYLDPVNGNDTWDGSCPIADRNALDEGSRGLRGPRRTLVATTGAPVTFTIENANGAAVSISDFRGGDMGLAIIVK